MKLTNAERLILASHYQILALLQPENAQHARDAEALESGFTGYCPTWTTLEEELSPEDSQFVTEVLLMYWYVQKQLPDHPDAPFPGFDHHHETDGRFASYVSFLHRHKSRPLPKPHSPDFGCGSPMEKRYRRMLKSLGKEPEFDALTAEGCRKLLALWDDRWTPEADPKAN